MKQDKTKLIAMYLPQYHVIPENNKWWGEGFTDWVGVKNAEPLYDDHQQPREPENDFYYDLSDIDTIRWQVRLAKESGIYGFCMYHYWFSSELSLLKKPAELLLENKDIHMPFCLAWDNSSWIRTWSKLETNGNDWAPKNDSVNTGDIQDGVLAQLDYGNEADWKMHFDYLCKFFKDDRYIKINNSPVFIIWTYKHKEILKKMCDYWRMLAKKQGFTDIYLISRLDPYHKMDGFDALFTYEPSFSAWQRRNVFIKVYKKIRRQIFHTEGLSHYDYDEVWKRLIKFAKKNVNSNTMYGAFVGYDDTPRRGKKAKIVDGGNPDKFAMYLKELLAISDLKRNPFLFLTAWNEWGEGAYLEPDKKYGRKYLEKIKTVLKEYDD